MAIFPVSQRHIDEMCDKNHVTYKSCYINPPDYACHFVLDLKLLLLVLSLIIQMLLREVTQYSTHPQSSMIRHSNETRDEMEFMHCNYIMFS